MVLPACIWSDILRIKGTYPGTILQNTRARRQPPVGQRRRYATRDWNTAVCRCISYRLESAWRFIVLSYSYRLSNYRYYDKNIVTSCRYQTILSKLSIQYPTLSFNILTADSANVGFIVNISTPARNTSPRAKLRTAYHEVLLRVMISIADNVPTTPPSLTRRRS